MKLIKIEAHGFKSFADPIILRFDGGIAGIVGPNGSGKSNINDAIKWVLGEQSAKELRGDEMKDVIFAGSKTTKPLDKATVTLTFENKDNLTSYEEDIISITRSLDRNKSLNEYFINGKLARHKDIKAIAMETGIGKSSLAIISQGTVSDIAQASDEQRRGIFEEAAGVSKYKFRKTESLRKLEKTDESLRVIQAHISELERQLVPLRKQAEKALIYKEKSNQLQNVEIAYLAQEIVRLDQYVSELNKELEGVEETKNDYKVKIEEYNTKITQRKVQQGELNKKISELSAKKNSTETRLNELKIIYNNETAHRNLIASGQVKANLHEKKEALQQAYLEEKQMLEHLIESQNEVQAKKEHTHQKLVQVNVEINELQTKINNLSRKKHEIETQIKILNAKKQSRSNLYKGVKTILDNAHNFKGLKGIVGDLIKVDREYASAIEAILASNIQHVVVDTSETAVKAIEFLKANNGGRASFIPLNSIKEKHIRDDYSLVVRNQLGFIGIASELVNVDEKYSVLNKFLLGNAIIVDNIQSANKISKIVEKKYLVVTKDGDIVRVGGIMSGGTKQESDDILGLEDKIFELQKLIPGINSLEQKNFNNLEQLKNQSINLQNYVTSYSNELSATAISIQHAQAKLDKIQSDFSLIGTDVTQINGEVINTTVERINQLDKELKNYLFELSANLQQKHKIDSEIEQLNELRNEANKLFSQLTQSFSNKLYSVEKSQDQLAQNRVRLSGFYNLTLENAIANYKLEIPTEKARELIDELRKEISALGNVNLDSIAQLEEVESKYDIYVSNRDELEEAKETVLNAIAELDKIIITRLTNIVNDVNVEFENVFRSMFGGGSAQVKFVDPNNVLESGISIYAQPPGKSVKNLKLFSGGEKSLIAISLLFAILKARPLPLCILDEVEAALDESNVVRYANYLQELKKQTQFIVITHRHGTMSRVDHLFGATMQNRGVTSFFSVKLSEAEKLIEQNKEQI
ncbi:MULTISPECIES: AAA family ATPase [unclassified Mycoplasma]|uniref:AAA family ATPase n=1 Tax=unclassified Mycoplasma TaxID=2683645 RepID=UPI00211C8F89|nr:MULTISPECIES: AAA family ATPase [unclassified Mycoplasma]UUM19776.1 AAA family ATPase [Mycoplasma sp. 1578d]UUM24759.1 AAA family ATPase [Mycoplasma sp. 3686d]